MNYQQWLRSTGPKEFRKAVLNNKRPVCAVDAIIKQYKKEKGKKKLQGLVLIKRKYYPVGWAFPAGAIDYGETVQQALKREVKEETNLSVKIERFLGFYDDPKRDRRYQSITFVFICSTTGTPKAGSDAKEAHIIPLNKMPKKMCFDHVKILKDAKKYLKH